MKPSERAALKRMLEAIAHLCESAIELLEAKPEPDAPVPDEKKKPRFLGDDDGQG